MLKYIENLRLMTKVVIPTAVMLAVALGIVALAERSLSKLTAQTHQIIHVTAARQALALVAAASVNSVAASEKNAMLMTDKAGLDVFATAYMTDMDHLKASIASLKELATDPAETDRLGQIDDAIAAYGATGEQLYQFMVDREFDQAHALSRGAAQIARERLIDLIRDEVDQSTAAMQQAEGVADTQYKRTLGLLIGLSVGGLICALLTVGWITTRFIVRPLTTIAGAIGRLSQGDLAISIDGADRRDEIGVLGRALVIFRDQSIALRESAETLNAAYAEIGELNVVLERRVDERTAELKDAHDALLNKERLAALGQLTATVAHELRNPLSAIRNTLSVIEESVRRAGLDLERPLGRVERGIKRCDGIIDDLLDYTRSRTLARTPAMADAWLLDLLHEQQLPAGIRLLPRPGAPDCKISIDVERMRRVVINLIENAAQAMAEPSPAGKERQITVRSTASATSYEIVVEDTGPGIEPEVLRKVFEPLFSTKSFGTGLGLPTVKQIVEQHEGSVELTSEPGTGTQVRIRLPRPSVDDIAA
jgi:signal transduction histidine kinase